MGGDSTPAELLVNGRKRYGFQKGNPGGPGRRPGYLRTETILKQALRAADARRAQLQEPCACAVSLLGKQADLADLWARSCRNIDEHFARRAYLDDNVLRVFQAKRLPDAKLPADAESTRPLVIQIVSYGPQPADVHVH